MYCWKWLLNRACGDRRVRMSAIASSGPYPRRISVNAATSDDRLIPAWQLWVATPLRSYEWSSSTSMLNTGPLYWRCSML